MKQIATISRKILDWYSRRRRITRALLIFVVFILPGLIHGYLDYKQTVARKIAEVTIEDDTLNITGETIKCIKLVCGKQFMIAGPVNLPEQCIRIDNTTLVYKLGKHTGVIKVYGEGNNTILVLVEGNYTVAVGNETIHAGEKLLVYNYNSDLDFNTLAKLLEHEDMAEQVCQQFTPSETCGYDAIPAKLYYSICDNLTKSPSK